MFLFIINIIFIVIYLFLKTKKNLHMLQQNFYNENNRYLKWCGSNLKDLIFNFDILSYIIIMFCATTNFKYMSTLLLIVYVISNIIYVIKMDEEQVKLPLKITKRVIRLIVTICIINFGIIGYFIGTFNEFYIYFYFIILQLLVTFNFFIVYLANIINIPIEKMVYNSFKNKAIDKLDSMTNLKVIGITGSYGKTSTKNILNTLLNTKYDSMTTPKNFNTKYGLIITINNYLDKFNDFFVAEMGAFKRGSIHDLCDMVLPEYGILTKIGEAHLDSFGSVDNIVKGKFELIESLPEDGVAVLNKDDERQVKYKLRNKCKVLWYGIENKDCYVYADNIKMNYKGMSFDCHFKDDEEVYTFETKLLGIPNVYNILSSLALCHYLGIEINKLQNGVKSLESIEHRLELKKNGEVTIIDDAYNSNPVGAKMALDVLNLMPGKKIVVTPGMIELKDKQEEYNYNFGKQISEVCDEVILVGKNQTKPIYKGLIDSKYSEKKIHIINDVKEAFKIINDIKDKDTYVLLENDLPDIFNEK